MKEIRDYSYSICNETLSIFVVDLKGNQYCVATIGNCGQMRNYELENLVIETLEELDYEVIGG